MPLHHRRVAALGATGALLLGGCGWERPTPLVTVFSGGTSEHTEAICWGEDEPVVLEGECLQGQDVTIPVRAGRTIGISVDIAAAEEGWVPFLGSEPLVPTREPLTEPYYRFTLTEEQLSEGPLPLRVVALNEERQPRGTWAFELVP